MSTNDDQITRKGAVATRIITRAQQRNHQARAAYLETRQLAGGVPWEVHHELQAAVLEFYQALRPLREHNAVEEFWNEAKLAEIQTGWTPVEKNGKIVDYRPKIDEIRGFENLEGMATQRTTDTKTVDDAFGEREVPVEDRDLVDPEILLRASQMLDEAATKLGFGPDIDESTPRTKIDDELIEEVEEWRKQNQ